VYEDTGLSYGELNRRANRLAHYLRGQGVRPDARVALCMERSLEMLVGVLAVLKAGGAYVPLDPAYPAERLLFMLQDSKPTVVMTQAHLEGIFAWQMDAVPIIEPGPESEMLWESKNEANPDRSAIGLTTAHLAYVIYTSGSTGQPKGVMIEHQSLANLVRWHADVFELGPGQYSSSLAGLGFDATVWEIWSTLSAGATLLLASSEDTHDPDRLLDWWSRRDIDVSFLPTPLAELAFARGNNNVSLRVLLTGGDRLQRLPAEAPTFSIINNYGPTETAVVATSGRVDSLSAEISIGRPIANTCVYILDAEREPVGTGVTGELYVGGPSLSRGYLNRAELTAERFVPNPFAEDSGARMYRTGDLGKWRKDGTIEFLGRNDFQVKIRGYRIELGEIEMRLAEHDDVQEAVVIAREDALGEKRLVAYYTEMKSSLKGPLQPSELRSYLTRILADYMVPTMYVRLDEMPLTPNGKLDRKALPAANFANKTVQRAPLTNQERILCSLFAEILCLESVGPDDDFFESGGHSLLATRLVNRIRTTLGTDFSMKALFEARTPSEIARRLNEDEMAHSSLRPALIPA